MRSLRVVIAGGVVPALSVVVLSGAADCGGTEQQQPCATADATPQKDSATDGPSLRTDSGDDGAVVDTGADTGPGTIQCSAGPLMTHIVPIPQPGVPADPGTLCAVAPPAQSNLAARVSLTGYQQSPESAKGSVAVPPAVDAKLMGTPTITVVSASNAQLAALVTSNFKRTQSGWTFDATWPNAIPKSEYGLNMTVKVSFTIDCGGGMSTTVEATHTLSLCIDGAGWAWASAGDACTVCTIIAEMAPSPIVSDNAGDDLPLARHLRLRVVELARAGREVLLFAENDGGADAEYEWRVSGGTLRRVAEDLVVWTLPDDDARPFGQVAVWNDNGAAVENFLWGAA